MHRVCFKCGSANAAASGDAAEACPQCGAIYAKVAAVRSGTARASTFEAAPDGDHERTGTFRYGIAFALAAIAALIVWAGVQFREMQQAREAERVANELRVQRELRAQRAAAAKQDADIAAAEERYQAALAAKQEYSDELAILRPLALRLKDAMDVLMRTRKKNIAEPMENLQALRRDLAALQLNTCLKDSGADVAKATEVFYQDTLNYMENKPIVDQDRPSTLGAKAATEQRDCELSVETELASSKASLDSIHQAAGR